MRPKILSKRILLIFVVTGCAFTLALVFYFMSKSLIHSDSTLIIENTVALQKQEQARSGLPMRLRIPSINVDANVEYVGLTSQGEMDVSKGPLDVAWFNLGPRPGEDGSAVIAGHSGWKNGIPAAFDNLYKLRKDDKLYVEDYKGVVISFVVREVQMYDPKADASIVFGSNDGKPHLNLITCEGVWNKTQKSYSERLVVFTDKE